MKPLALGLILSLFSPLALANLEINRASQAELERLSGVGPRASFAATDSMLMPLKKSGRQASERTGSEAP
jgi:hypothetical protein